MDTILHYFPEISSTQREQFLKAMTLYKEWNEKINVISRKDIEQIEIRHFLHSLGIAKVQTFLPNSKILDVGTGGGFPGVPLAILFPESQFYLVDSIGKKIKVVQEIAKEIGLTNIKAEQRRAETISSQFDSQPRSNTNARVCKLGKRKNKEKIRTSTSKWHLISERRRFIRRIKALYKHYRVSFI